MRGRQEEEEEAGHLGSFGEGNAYLLPAQWEETKCQLMEAGREEWIQKNPQRKF